MNHGDILKLLYPIDLQGVNQDDMVLEGKQLDTAQASAERLLRECFPDMTCDLLASWERVYGLVPFAEDPMQLRIEKLIQKIRAHGGLSRAYFISLAATMSYTIAIEEYLPFMCGWGRCGDPLYVPEVRWIWRVSVSGYPLYYFRAGQSGAGERLLWWPAQTALENIFNELKPAHTHIIYDYS